MFIRHGARTRCSGTAGSCWPGDEHTEYTCTQEQVVGMAPSTAPTPTLFAKAFMPGRNILPGNCMLGQLTAVGRAQQAANGRALRAAYAGANATVGDGAPLLPDAYADAASLARDVFLRSDNEERTIMSGQALAAALLVPDGAPGPGGGVAAAPLPWHTMDEAVDNIEPNPKLCPAYTKAAAAAQASPAFRAFVAGEVAALAADLAPVLNQSAGSLTPSRISQLFDCFWTHWCPGDAALRAAIPPALLAGAPNATLVDRLNAVVGRFEGLLDSDAAVARFGAGPLLADLLALLRPAAAASASAKKFALFSGHDTGPMMPVLGAFGVFDAFPYVFTPYASLIAVELLEHSASGKLMVRVIYNGRVMRVPWAEACGPYGGSWPGAGDWLCAYEGFAARVAAMVPTAAECAAA